MKTPHFVTQIADSEGVRSTVEAIATHPKVATATIIGNGSILAAYNTEVITGYLAFYSTVLTGVVSTIMAAYWMVKLVREWVGMTQDLKK